MPGVRVAEGSPRPQLRRRRAEPLLSRRHHLLRSWQGWLYLVAVQDLYSRRIVGWAIADHLRAELVTDALEKALAHRRPAREVARPPTRTGFDRLIELHAVPPVPAFELPALLASTARWTPSLWATVSKLGDRDRAGAARSQPVVAAGGQASRSLNGAALKPEATAGDMPAPAERLVEPEPPDEVDALFLGASQGNPTSAHVRSAPTARAAPRGTLSAVSGEIVPVRASLVLVNSAGNSFTSVTKVKHLCRRMWVANWSRM